MLEEEEHDQSTEAEEEEDDIEEVISVLEEISDRVLQQNSLELQLLVVAEERHAENDRD